MSSPLQPAPARRTTGATDRDASDISDGRGYPAALWGIWLLAFAIILGLTAAVVWHLSQPTDHMSHMSGSRTDAFTRLRSDAPLQGMLGRQLVTAWQLDLSAVVLVLLAAGWYLTRLVQAKRRDPALTWPVPRTLAFLGGLAFCIYATNGSAAVYDQVLFSAHMIGHLALVMAAPALLAMGQPVELALLARDEARRAKLERVLDGRFITVAFAPPVVVACYAVVIVGSHLTGLMDTIMRSNLVGQFEHVVYVAFGFQFFALVVGDTPLRWRLSTPGKWAMLAIAMAVDTITGVVLLQTTRPVAMQVIPGLRVNPVKDTQTGGAIMWFGGDGIMAAIMIALVIGWLGDPERQRTDNKSWAERARRSTFAEHTGESADQLDNELDFDDQDDRLAQYNKWLADLHRNEPS
ncbi:MAG TPA: cytochrome c oxidase assembly protein [Jatrophihabitans sp.]|jgi:putative copper resistance protein D